VEKVIRWIKFGRPPGGSKGAALQLASGRVTFLRSAGSQTRSIARAVIWGMVDSVQATHGP